MRLINTRSVRARRRPLASAKRRQPTKKLLYELFGLIPSLRMLGLGTQSLCDIACLRVRDVHFLLGRCPSGEMTC
jgi:hypothetical protein